MAETNEFERDAREQKARRLADALEHHLRTALPGTDSIEIAVAGQEAPHDLWCRVADVAGIRAPSYHTVNRARQLLRERAGLDKDGSDRLARVLRRV